VSGAPAATAAGLAPPNGPSGDASGKAGDNRLAQSERVGQQLTAELLHARLKGQRVAAKQEKDQLNAQIRALGEQVGGQLGWDSFGARMGLSWALVSR
jgi:hypothetical protein